MFKKITILLLVLSSQINAQVNLVPNPSFETYTACPNSGGQIVDAIGWDSYIGSVDYFNLCAPVPSFQTPNNGFGYQSPVSGNAYAGLITYWDGGFAREIMGIQLTTSLNISQKYYISFYATLASKGNVVGYSSNKLGIKLSKVALYMNTPINNSSNYFYNTDISDTLIWTHVFGSFIADSAYKNLMIGNFFDNSNSTITNHALGSYAYYFIDDVCLSTDSIFCKNFEYVGINEIYTDNKMQFFPNPANNTITIRNDLILPIKIFNSLGDEISFIIEQKRNLNMIDCSNWETGIYFIKAKNLSQKIIINH